MYVYIYYIVELCIFTRADMTAVVFGMLAPYAMCACAYRAANVFAFAVVIDDSSAPLFLEAAIGLLLIVASKLYIHTYI